jgi:hypothetical protein
MLITVRIGDAYFTRSVRPTVVGYAVAGAGSSTGRYTLYLAEKRIDETVAEALARCKEELHREFIPVVRDVLVMGPWGVPEGAAGHYSLEFVVPAEVSPKAKLSGTLEQLIADIEEMMRSETPEADVKTLEDLGLEVRDAES